MWYFILASTVVVCGGEGASSVWVLRSFRYASAFNIVLIGETFTATVARFDFCVTTHVLRIVRFEDVKQF